VSHPSSRLWFAAALAVCSACAHIKSAADLESLKAAADTFHQRIRWRDFRGASELIAPEQRAAFQAARDQLRDERDLSITDYQLEDARLSADGSTAVVVSRVSWTRLPSLSEASQLVTSEFVLRDGAWLLAHQSGGPFAELSAGASKESKAVR